MKPKTFAARTAQRAGIVLLGLAALGLAGCFYVPASAGHGTARASIGLGKSLPANLTGTFTLVVGGPGMSTITQQYQLGTTTSGPLDIPSGIARTFTLIANTSSVTLIGQATVDLAPGETKDVVLMPVAAGSQIIAPDYSNGRLVQIADMAGAGWTELGSVYTNDVDFDDEGRLYFVSGTSVVRIDDISGSNPTPVAGTGQFSIEAIAMDRPRGLLYYIEGSTLKRKQVMTKPMGTEEQIVTSTVIEFINTNGITVDSDGMVYIANNGTPNATVLKLNPDPPSAPTVVASYSGTLVYPWDVLARGDDIYVSDNGTPGQVPGKIVRLTRGLQPVDSFPGPASDPFLGPEWFVAVLNKPITLIDETPYSEGNRLVSFNDMTGEGWTTFRPTNAASGLDEFGFFYNNIGS